jgi:hypothetical protein
VEETHAALACGTYEAHDAPHAPQLETFDVRSTQELPHAVWPAGQPLQSPLTHICPAPQTTPHVPQFFGSELTLTSHPVAEFPSQST